MENRIILPIKRFCVGGKRDEKLLSIEEKISYRDNNRYNPFVNVTDGCLITAYFFPEKLELIFYR
jgi:hypothetical protein